MQFEHVELCTHCHLCQYMERMDHNKSLYFDLCQEDSEDEIFLTQVVKEELQKLLNKTMTMDDNFDFNLDEKRVKKKL